MAQIYSQVLSYVNDVCSNYIGTNVAKVAAAISPTAYALLGIYIMLWGLAHMRGLIQEPITDAAIRIIKIVFIFSIAVQLANYNVYITDAFYNTPEELAQLLARSADAKTSIQTLDNIVAKGFAMGSQFWSKGGVLHGDFGMYIIASIVYLVTIVVTAYACFLIVLSKIAMSLIISLGPIFILTLLFQPTANFFNSWIQQLANYFLLIVLVAAANLFIIDLFAHAADTITSSVQIDQIFPFLITGFVSLFVLAQLPPIAAGLAGGISLSSYGVGRMGLSVLSRPARDLTSWGYGKAKEKLDKGRKYAQRKAWEHTGGRLVAAYRSRKNSVSKG